MPVTYFDVQWPDGSRERCYSPSSVVRERLELRAYTVAEFCVAARGALHEASERVRAKFGYACSSALDELRGIEARASVFPQDAEVRVLGFASAEQGR